MSDLISRSAVLKIIDEAIMNTSDFLQHDTQIDIQFKVEELPTVEAKPVVHGEWIDTQPGYHNGYYRNAHKCSNCQDYYTTEYDDLYFCPRCGADMRKKVE